MLMFSVYTLKERCLQEVRRLLPSSAIDSLGIPRTLKSELLQIQSLVQPMKLTTSIEQNASSMEPVVGNLQQQSGTESYI